MRKTVGILLFIVVGLSVSMTSVDALLMSIPETTGYVGKCVTIPVEMKDADGIGSIELTITYDTSMLDFKKVEKGGLTKGLVSYNASQPGSITIGLVDSTGITGTGNVLLITFEVLKEGNTTVSLSDVNAYDVDTYATVDVETTDGVVIAVIGGETNNQSGFEMILLITAFMLVTVLVYRKTRK